MPLRFCEGFELGCAASLYVGSGLSYEWEFVSGAGGNPDPASTSALRWVPTLGYGGGSYALALPHEATARARQMAQPVGFELTSFVLAFAFALDCDASGVKANHDLLTLTSNGTDFVRVRTQSSGSPVKLDLDVWNGTSWHHVASTSSRIAVGTRYWLVLEARQVTSGAYPLDVRLHIGDDTNEPTLEASGSVDLNQQRELDDIKWKGVADNGGGGTGDTIVDSCLVWDDPDGDAPYTLRRWWIAALEVDELQSTVGPATWNYSGTATSIVDALTDPSAVKYARGIPTSTSTTARQALRLQDLADVNPNLPTYARDFAGLAATAIVSVDAVGDTGYPYVWRGGSYVPPLFDPLYSFGSSFAPVWRANVYGVDPTNERWTAQTIADTSAILTVNGQTSSSMQFDRYVVQVAWNGLPPVVSALDVEPGPAAYLLPHDRRLVRTNAALSSVDGVDEPSQLGAYIGATYPLSTNQGNIQPFHGAETWNEDASTKHPSPTGFAYRLQVAGGVLNTAEFAWRFVEEDAASYRGEIDVRHECDHHNPWTPTNREAAALLVVYSRAFDRVIVGRYMGVASVNYWWHCRYRSASTVERTNWTGDLYFPDPGGLAALGYAPAKLPDTTLCSWTVAWETPDGALRVSYVYRPTWASSSDMDIWGSSDGGNSWQLLHEGVLSRTLGRTTQPRYLSADTSGDWVRLTFFDGAASPAGIVTIASSDRGSSWTIVQDTPDGNDIVQADYLSFATNGASRAMHSIVGLDSVDGAFLRCRAYDTGSGKDLRIDYAAGTDDWEEIWGASALHAWSGANLQHVHATRTPNHLAIVLEYTDGTRDGFKLAGLLIQRDRVLTGRWTNGYSQSIADEWTVFARENGTGAASLDGNVYMAPYLNRIVWAGDSLVHLFGLYDQGNSSGSSAQGYTNVSYLGGWDRRALHIPEAANIGRTNGLWVNKWSSAYGYQNQFASPYYLSVGSGSASVVWNAERMQITCTTSDSRYFTQGTTVGSLTQHMGDAGIIVWNMKAGTTNGLAPPSSVGTYDNPRLGVYATATGAAGTTVHVGVHFTTAGILVVDQAAGSVLHTDATTDFWSIPREYRLAFAYSQRIGRGGIQHFVEFAHKARGHDQPWITTGLLTAQNGHVSGHITELVQWGHVLNPSGSTVSSDWMDFAYARDWLSNVVDFRNPEDLRGAQLSPYSRHVAQGVHVSWGGGGGFVNDQWSSLVEYEYGVDQLAAPSPSMFWQTKLATTTAVIFDAAVADKSQTNTVPAKFLHNAAALVGTNFRRCVLDYAGTTDFASPVSASLTLDAAVFSLRVASATTNSVSLDRSVAAGSLLRSNACAGWMVEVATPTAGTTHDGEVLRIRESWDDRVVFDLPPEPVLSIAPAGSTLTFFPPQMLLPYAKIDSTYATGIEARFLRLSLAPSVSQIPSGDEGYRVGRVVAGMTLPIDVPLDWEYSDEQESNVELYTADSGTRSAYVQGRARRTIKANSVGDVARWRDSFRGTIREIAKYEANPLVLVVDSTSPNDSMLYSRLVSSTEFDNLGWRYDTTNTRWHAVGDVSATWEEEV